MAGWTTGICEANGITAHYLRTGGDKPPIVLLHGLTANGACWLPLAQELEKDYDVVMPDARGHGNSSIPDHGYHYDDLADDVESLIDALRLATPVLLGHSMGGLILADPTFLTLQRQREVHESAVVNQHRRILKQPREAHLAEMRVRHSRRSSEIIELLTQARFQTSIHAFEVLTPPNPDYVKLINTLDVPSLLIVGDNGSVVSPEVAAELAELNHFLKVVQIAEVSHGLPYDQPKRFSAIVQAFLHSLANY
ncbi:MAG: alpha/beta hydrolase [Parachlamydiales bacterium]|nr:alpha/beta hydrolase [Candidatus Acheromyda pituitae]